MQVFWMREAMVPQCVRRRHDVPTGFRSSAGRLSGDRRAARQNGRMTTDDDVATVLELERELQTADCRRDPARLRALLADDFSEVGASGRTWDRAETLDLLAGESDDDAAIELHHLRGRVVGDGYVMARWDSHRAGRRARRSSLWRRGALGWQLVHHQGTPLVAATTARAALEAAYRALLADVERIDDELGWQSTRCTAWTARDLLHHLLTDAQRGLVALHTPTPVPPDVDAVSYWLPWRPDTPGAEAGRRGTRIMASAWSSVRPIAELYAETARAVLVAAGRRDATEVVATQGHALTAGDLCSTLAVEATVHHLDLRLGAPSAAGLAETRRVLDGLLDHRSPLDDDVRWALVGTGREAPTSTERAALGADAGRLPLFG